MMEKEFLDSWEIGGKTCLITGANAGIGYQAALRLANLGAHVLLGCRSKERGERAAQEIRNRTSNPEVHFVELDLSKLASVVRFSHDFLRSGRPLHVLVLNAGVMPMLPQPRQETTDGLELCFGVNYVGHFLLTLLLTKALKQGQPSRVIAVSSITHTLGGIDLANLNLTKEYTHDKAYTQSKFAAILFANEYNKRYQHLGINANSLCPGIVASDILNDKPWWLRIPGKLVMRAIGKPPYQGADTIVHVSTAPELSGVGGRFFQDSKEASPHPTTNDEFVAAQLWEKTINILSDKGIELGEIIKEGRIVPPAKNYKAETVAKPWLYYYMAIYGKVYLLVAAALLFVALVVKPLALSSA